MKTVRLTIRQAGHCVVQDLGRPGYASIGIPANGAADQHAARTANILTGNADRAPLLEITGSELTFTADADVLLAVTGAATTVVVDGHALPAWETLTVFAGSQVRVPTNNTGFRSYVAINGTLQADRTLGSVAPDRLLSVGRSLSAGDTVDVRTDFTPHRTSCWAPLFRLGATPVRTQDTVEVDAIPGPDIDRICGGLDALEGPFVVSPQSDHIGLRLSSPPIERTTTDEILSRGVPVGAIEVPPNGGIIMLLRGRLVTAGYPVLAVATSESLDRLGQARPGATVRVKVCSVDSALTRLRARSDERLNLARRVREAFTASGIQNAISDLHTSTS